jgi:hypothetical protein
MDYAEVGQPLFVGHGSRALVAIGDGTRCSLANAIEAVWSGSSISSLSAPTRSRCGLRATGMASRCRGGRRCYLLWH